MPHKFTFQHFLCQPQVTLFLHECNGFVFKYHIILVKQEDLLYLAIWEFAHISN